jgi:segregation and condensation protein A
MYTIEVACQENGRKMVDGVFALVKFKEVIKMEIDESQLIKTIVMAADWQEVVETIVVEEGLDPLNIDITKLVDAFMGYLQKIEGFDFRIPARFILIASILLGMKCELLLEKEEEKELKNIDIPKLNLEAPLLIPPLLRKPTKKVTLIDLINALNKTMEIKRRKESVFITKRPEIEIIEPEDIEERIEETYEIIKNTGMIRFSDLVPTWKRKEIIDTLMPLLHLAQRGLVICEQEEIFKDIYIKLK